MQVVEEKDNHLNVDEKETHDVVVRFAGDSGDGMQLTGTNFTQATALYGNDLPLSQIFQQRLEPLLELLLEFLLFKFILVPMT